ncbi:MAG TPA: PadR family transcriptional regulator [Solirubrobacteraceae bacterium]|nr:PadR family transcriptional regulator [Solirubrobacteraceae bacterium]
MSHEDWAAPWPFLSRVSAMKSAAREGRRGRYSGLDDLERLAALRHMRHGPPFGGPMWGGGGPFGGGRGRRRRGDVRTAVLILLAEEPRNGYQLMQTIEERSGGRWRPSPGSVYPTLAQLEDEGLIRGIERDGTKLFELTDAGREQAEQFATRTAPWEDSDETGGRSIPEIASLIIQIGKAAWQVAQEGDERQVEKACETLAETRRALYRILAEEPDADEDEDATA